MKSFFTAHGPRENPLRGQPQVVVIGNFDGIHRGHQELIRRALSWGHKLSLPVIAVTFDPHPLAVLRPPHLRLFDLEDQQAQFRAQGLDGVVYLSFSRDFSQLSAPEFLEKVLGPELNPKALVVGFNFRFGSARGGSVDLLKEWGQRHQCEVEIVEPVQTEAGLVSTSAIRKFLSEGAVGEAARLLGRPYALSGIVVHGESRGRGLGFPTANVHLEKVVFPKPAVYATRTWVGSQRYDSVTHLGPLPTFGDEVVRLETHLFEFDGDLYGQRLRVEFIEHLREVRRFGSVQELRDQIPRDSDLAREILRRKS